MRYPRHRCLARWLCGHRRSRARVPATPLSTVDIKVIGLHGTRSGSPRCTTRERTRCSPCTPSDSIDRCTSEPPPSRPSRFVDGFARLCSGSSPSELVARTHGRPSRLTVSSVCLPVPCGPNGDHRPGRPRPAACPYAPPGQVLRLVTVVVDRRPLQLRTRLQPPGRHQRTTPSSPTASSATHRVPADAAGHGDAAGHRRGHRRLPDNYDDKTQEPTSCRRGSRTCWSTARRHRRRHGHQHPAAQPARGRRRRRLGAGEPGGRPTRSCSPRSWSASRARTSRPPG